MSRESIAWLVRAPSVVAVGLLVISTLLFGNQSAVIAIVPMALLLSSPAWTWFAMRKAQDAPTRASLLITLNTQLSLVAAMAVGAVLTLVFIGVVVVLVVTLLLATFPMRAARQVRDDLPVIPLPYVRTFVH